MRRRNSSSLHSGDGVRPRSCHLAISFSSMKLFAGDVGIRRRAWRRAASPATTVAWPQKRTMTCVSPRALAVTSPPGVTAATPSLSASNWAVAVTSSTRPSLQVAVTRICCCSPGTMTRCGGQTSSCVDVGSLGARAPGRRLRASACRRSYSRRADLEALAAAVLHEPAPASAAGCCAPGRTATTRRPSALCTIWAWSNAGSKPSRLSLKPPRPCCAPWQAPLVAAGLGQDRHDLAAEADRHVGRRPLHLDRHRGRLCRRPRR